jgi:ArsR family transcriptional regulator, arsenate/arsenite/antimonite-responsive transcriptional repressor
VKLIRIYQCFCDETRLRIINLLIRGPLCVCHIQQIVGESQVNVSRHLSYLKDRGMVEARRHQNWMIYRLPEKRSVELESNLKCLQDCATTESVFKSDLSKLKKVLAAEGVREVLAQSCCRSNSCHSKRC